MELKRLRSVLRITSVPALLIVPYGIETHEAQTGCSLYSLLIVPYGIETQYGSLSYSLFFSFNRTLWN